MENFNAKIEEIKVACDLAVRATKGGIILYRVPSMDAKHLAVNEALKTIEEVTKEQFYTMAYYKIYNVYSAVFNGGFYEEGKQIDTIIDLELNYEIVDCCKDSGEYLLVNDNGDRFIAKVER